MTKKAEVAANNSYEEIGNREKVAHRETNKVKQTDNVSVLFIGVDGSSKSNQDDENSPSDAFEQPL